MFQLIYFFIYFYYYYFFFVFFFNVWNRTYLPVVQSKIELAFQLWVQTQFQLKCIAFHLKRVLLRTACLKWHFLPHPFSL